VQEQRRQWRLVPHLLEHRVPPLSPSRCVPSSAVVLCLPQQLLVLLPPPLPYPLTLALGLALVHLVQRRWQPHLVPPPHVPAA